RVWLLVLNDSNNDIYRTVAQETPLLQEILQRARTLPDVKEAAVSDLASIPLGHAQNTLNPFPLIRKNHENEGMQTPLIDALIVTPEYFHVLGMALLRGRLFSDTDNNNSPSIVVINEALTRTHFTNKDPLSKQIK